MQSSASTSSRLEEFIKCSMCSDVFTDPRTLPCMHTFCMACIDGLWQDKLPGNIEYCPLCTKRIIVPDGGISSLPDNNFIEKLKLINELSSKRPVECEACSISHTDASRRNMSTMYCAECKERLCTRCASCHKAFKMFRSHNLVKLGDDVVKSKEYHASVCSPSTCKDHTGKQLELYCTQCQSAICVLCYVEVHNTHKCSNICQVYDEFRSRMKMEMTDLAKGITKCCGMALQLKRNKDEFIDLVERRMREVYDAAEDLKMMIDKHKDKLLNQLTSWKHARLVTVESVSNDVRRHESLIISLRRYLEQIADKGTDSDIAQQSTRLHHRVGELMNFDALQSDIQNVGSVEVKFTAEPSLLSNIENVVGKLDFKILARGKKIMSPTLSHAIKGDSVRVVTTLDNQLFVLREPTQQKIEVYDVKTCSLQRRICIRELSDFNNCGLAACSQNNCLYVSDHCEHIVRRIEPATGNNVLSWSVAESPTGLYVTNAYNLLVTSMRCNTIQEYTAIGSLVRKISLPSDVTGPHHAVQLLNGQYLVSHRGPITGLSIVGIDGHLVRSFRNRPDTAATNFNGPVQMSVCRNGFICVADRYNNRIVILDDMLIWSRDLPLTLDDGLQGPTSVCLDESRGRLYVGEWRGRRLLVFDNAN